MAPQARAPLDSSSKRKRVARSEPSLEDGEKPSKPNKSAKASSVTETTTASSATHVNPRLQPASQVFVLVHTVRDPYRETEIDVNAAFDSVDKANEAARALFEQEHPEWARGPDGEENEWHVDNGGSSSGDGNYTYETFDGDGAVSIVGQGAEGERSEVYVQILAVNEI